MISLQILANRRAPNGTDRPGKLAGFLLVMREYFLITARADQITRRAGCHSAQGPHADRRARQKPAAMSMLQRCNCKTVTAQKFMTQ